MVVDGQGSIVAAYRKVHLFNVSVHNGPVLMEGRGTAPGQQVRDSKPVAQNQPRVSEPSGPIPAPVDTVSPLGLDLAPRAA